MAKLNITWAQFAICNENPTKSFEDMCRKLFRAEFLNNSVRTHSNHNNAGIEVLPVLEPKREGGMPQKRISFQSKYVEQPSYAYSEFQKSAKITAENYKGELDLVYLFCNKTLSTTAKGYSNIVKIHADAGIETWPISDSELLDMVSDYPDIAEYYFQARIVADTTSMQPVFFRGVPAYIITEDQVSVQSTNKKLLHVLVGEKIINCRKYALTLEMESLKMEVDKLISSGAEDNEFYFYQFLIQLHEGKSTSETIKKCTADYKREAEWLIKLYDTPSSVSAYELSKHMPVVQIFTVKKLFDALCLELNGCREQAIDVYENMDWRSLYLLNGGDNYEEIIVPVTEFLNRKGIHYMTEFSGRRGIHVWVIFDQIIGKELGFRILNEILQNIPIEQHADFGWGLDKFPATDSKKNNKVGKQVKFPLSTHLDRQSLVSGTGY